MRNRRTNEECIASARKYKSSSAWRAGDFNAYTAAWRRGILDQCFSHMTDVKLRAGSTLPIHSLESCKADAARFKRRSDWTRESSAAVQAAKKHGWFDECVAHMSDEHYHQWTKEECAAEAAKYSYANAFKHGSFRAYRSAHQNGWYEEITAHFAARYPKGTVALARFIERAKEIHGEKYDYSRVVYSNKETKVEIICPEHGPFMQSPGKHLHGKCGCPACGKVQPTDNDTIYIWRAVGQYFNGNPVFKIGITSQRCGDDRIRKVAKKWGFDFEVVCCTYVNGRATDLEGKLHEMGDDPQLLGIDGCTEFRALDGDQLASALVMINEVAQF